MDAVSAKDAHRFYVISKFLNDINEICYDKCVVDFQTKDLGTMEKECALACLKK